MTKEVVYGLAVALSWMLGRTLIGKHASNEIKHKKQYKSTPALIGDVGGTNIRLQLIIVKPPHDSPQKILKKAQYLVQNQPSFEQALRKFLSDVQLYPQIAAVAMAGPVKNNRLSMANVRKWGQINGDQLAQNLKIRNFQLLNDFEANTYGLLIVPDSDFESLNNFDTDKHQTLGIMGPGTGLGNSVLYTSPFRHRERVYVLTSEGGHTDIPYIDDEVIQYIKFFKRYIEIPDIEYISLQRSFCGPAIPMMYKFYAQKYPEAQQLQNGKITSKEIINKCMEENPSIIFANVFRLFMKIYEAAMGNFLAQHMCTGGLILVGSLTNRILPKLKQMKLLKQWKKRHVQFSKNIEEVPIVICKQIDLGLKGAYVIARRIIADEQHD